MPDHPTACPYQNPGGLWGTSTDGTDVLPETRLRRRGMVLDKDQRNLILPRPDVPLAADDPEIVVGGGNADEVKKPTMEGADATSADDDVRSSLLERGLLFAGYCPRCAHSMQDEITFGVKVDEAEICRMIAASDVFSVVGAGASDSPASRLSRLLHESSLLSRRLRQHEAEEEEEQEDRTRRMRRDATLTFVCSCGHDHKGRPADAKFVGCGAVWTQPPVGNDETLPEDWRLGIGTAEDAIMAATARDLSVSPLTRIRTSANQWRNGAAGLTAVLTAAALVQGPANATGLHPLGKWLTGAFSGLGFVFLLAGTWFAISSSFGVSGYDHQLLAPAALRRYERRRGQQAIRQMELSRGLIVGGVVLVAVSAYCAFLNP